MSETVSLVRPGAVELLDVGSGPTGDVPKAFFPDARVHRLDVDERVRPDTVHDIRRPLPHKLRDRFDIVFLSHVLEHLGRYDILPSLKNLVPALRPGGEMWVIVPDLEWAAHELLKDRPSPAVWGVLYGQQDNEYQYHKFGFRLFELRQVMSLAGMAIRSAYHGQVIVRTQSGEWPAIQNIVMGLRVDGLEPAKG